MVDNSVLQNIAIENNSFEYLLGPAIQLNSSKDVSIRHVITNSNVGSYSYAVGKASTRGSMVIADSVDVSGKSNEVSLEYGPISIDPQTTKSIDVELNRLPNPTGTIDERFGEMCGAGAVCYYTAGSSEGAHAIGCGSGALRIRQATYGSAANGLIESCLAPVQKSCNGKASCEFAFSAASCGVLDPDPHETSAGSILATCQ